MGDLFRNQLTFTGWSNSNDIRSFTYLALATGYVNIYGSGVGPSSTIYTLSGSDSVSSSITWNYASGSRGTCNMTSFYVSNSDSLLDMGDGNNTLSGSMMVGGEYYRSTVVPGSLTGIRNNGTILTGSGADTLQGKVEITAGIGVPQPRANSLIYAIYNTGLINTGAGNDNVNCIFTNIQGSSSAIGLYNSGQIRLDEGDDRIYAVAGGFSPQQFYGIYNQNGGVIDFGNGNNIISAYQSVSNGGSLDIIYNGSGSTIQSGSGLDSINCNQLVNYGTISLGDGVDTLTGLAPGNLKGLISNQTGGLIDLGLGNDTIRTNSLIVSAGSSIYAGVGDDNIICGKFAVGASTANFSGGVLDLGDGNDTLNGFGIGNVQGGTGFDKYLIQAGGYQVTVFNDHFDVTQLLSTGQLSSNTTSLYGFESLGSSISGGASITPLSGKYLFGTDGSIIKAA